GRPQPKAGVTATYTVDRDGNTILVPVRPDNASMLTTRAQILDGDIAYLRVYSFFTAQSDNSSRDYYREYIRDLDKEIETLKAAKPAGWLLDMRNNPGGNEGLAAYLTGRFGLQGTFVENRGRGDKAASLPASGKSVTDGKPVAVLINEQSASAAEMVAAVLQDGGI